MIPTTWLHIGTNLIVKERFKPIQNSPYTKKPLGGLWLSPLKLDGEWMSDWHEFFGGGGEAVIVTLRKDARILTIDSMENLHSFIKEVGTAPNPLEHSFLTSPDFKNAAELYDVIYLTDRGEYETRFSKNFDDPNLYGWDVESCVVLNFDAIEKQVGVNLIKNEPAW